MAKDGRKNGYRRTAAGQAKHALRIAARKQAWKKTGDGAGSRTPAVPARHHRQPRRGRK